MKILHVIPSVSNTQGGTTFALKNMVRCLAGAGQQVDVATTDDAGGIARLEVPLEIWVEADGARYIYFRRQTGFYKVSLPLGRWVARHVQEYDLVHVHAVFSHTSIAAARQAARQHVPYVVQPHGILNQWGLINSRSFLKQISLRWLERPLLRRAAAICLTSEQERREVAQVGIGSVSPMTVIPLGIDTDTLTRLPSPEIFYARFPAARGRPVILFLSRLDPKKGLELLLRSFAEVHRKVPGSLLVIAGDGAAAYVATLHEIAAELEILTDILWTGFLVGEEKFSALAAATVFTLTSYSENFAIAAAESLAAGIPSVLSDQVALAEDAGAADAALVVPCEVAAIVEALKQALGDSSLRERLGKNARQLTLSKFSMEGTTHQLVTLYRSISER